MITAKSNMDRAQCGDAQRHSISSYQCPRKRPQKQWVWQQRACFSPLDSQLLLLNTVRPEFVSFVPFTVSSGWGDRGQAIQDSDPAWSPKNRGKGKLRERYFLIPPRHWNQLPEMDLISSAPATSSYETSACELVGSNIQKVGGNFLTRWRGNKFGAL